VDRIRRSVRVPLLFVLAASLAAPLRASVWKVGGSGQTHPTIQAAVDASVDGDVILVRGGAQNLFTVDGKGISIVADQSAPLDLHEGFIVRNLAAGKTFSVSGLRVLTTYHYGMWFQNCAGSIRAQDVQVVVATSAIGFEGVRVEQCADVAFERCSANGGQGYTLELGYAGFYLDASTVAFHDCVAIGGKGGDGGYYTGVPLNGEQGGPGLLVQFSTVFLSNSSISGGVGGDGLDGPLYPPCFDYYNHPTLGGPGGYGIEVVGTYAIVRLLQTRPEGGPGGLGGEGCSGHVGNEGPGLPLHVYSGTVITLNDKARSITVPRPAREGSQLAFDLTGEPSDRAYLLLSLAPEQVFSSALNGVLLGAPPYRRVFLGTLDQAGTLHATLPVSELGPGVTHRLLHAQCLMVDTQGASRVGGSAELLMLDSSY
jgi:hypothetical protein